MNIRSSKLFFVGIIFGLLTVSSIVFGQSQTQRTGSQQPRRESAGAETPNRGGGRVGPDVIMSSDGDYQLAPSDVIKIVIEDAPELSSNYRLDKNGNIPMKYLGTMSITGKTPDEVSVMIADGLRGRYLKDPKVYVSVEQYNSRSFFIQGSVRSPGVFVIEGRPSLFKLISIAGGLLENHGSTAYIIREKKASPDKIEKARAGIDQGKKQDSNLSPTLNQVVENSKDGASKNGKDGTVAMEDETEYELITAHINGLYRGRFEQNLIIQPNDLVYIPPSDVFFVAGEVKAPGQFPLREGTTLRQAISLAQGTFFKSATDRAIIFRQDLATGKLTEVPVDIGAVMSGKAPDVLLMPNDLVMVPNSKVKTVGGTLMMALASGLIYRIPVFGR